MSDMEEQPTKASSVMKKIDEQITLYNKAQAKIQWAEIDKHWKKLAVLKKEALEKAKSLLTEEELLSIGIITQ